MAALHRPDLADLRSIRSCQGCQLHVQRGWHRSRGGWGLVSPSLGKVVEGGQPPSQVVRLLISRRHCDSEADALGHRSHGRDDGQGLVYRPLRAGDDGRIQGAAVDIIATCTTTTTTTDMG